MPRSSLRQRDSAFRSCCVAPSPSVGLDVISPESCREVIAWRLVMEVEENRHGGEEGRRRGNDCDGFDKASCAHYQRRAQGIRITYALSLGGRPGQVSQPVIFRVLAFAERMDRWSNWMRIRCSPFPSLRIGPSWNRFNRCWGSVSHRSQTPGHQCLRLHLCGYESSTVFPPWHFAEELRLGWRREIEQCLEVFLPFTRLIRRPRFRWRDLVVR